jgi:hypothetical protein
MFFFVPGNSAVSWDPVTVCCDAVGDDRQRSLIDPSCLVTTEPWSSTQDNLFVETYSSTNLISSEVQIAERIGHTGEPCRTPASTGCLSMALLWIMISTVLSERQFSVHCIRSPSICLTFIKLTCLPFATRVKATLISMRCTPSMWWLVYAA